MKDYEMREGSTHCHTFIDAESYTELLNAISKWWAPKESEEGTCIVSIQFEIDDDSYNCHVYWISPPPGFDIVKEYENQIAREKANPLDLPELGE